MLIYSVKNRVTEEALRLADSARIQERAGLYYTDLRANWRIKIMTKCELRSLHLWAGIRVSTNSVRLGPSA